MDHDGTTRSGERSFTELVTLTGMERETVEIFLPIIRDAMNHLDHKMVERCMPRFLQAMRTISLDKADQVERFLPLTMQSMDLFPTGLVEPCLLWFVPLAIPTITRMEPGKAESVCTWLPAVPQFLAYIPPQAREHLSPLLKKAMILDDPTMFFDDFDPHIPRPSSFPTPDEVRRKSKDLASQIFQNYMSLGKILEHHEETIQKRWLKMTRQQRVQILLKAWPNMPTQHRPDIEAVLQHKTHEVCAETYKWPHIDLEDLATPKLFLIFVNARGRNPPSLFAHVDHESWSMGCTIGTVSTAWLNRYTFMFTMCDNPESYAQLVSWDEDPNALEWLQSKRGVQPGEGIMTLEIQSRIYQFLLDCCLAIMKMSVDTLHSSAKDLQLKPEPPTLSTAEPGVNVLAVVAAEAPYRLPTRLDLDRLLGLVAAKLSAATDHVWSLREDPGYFAEVALDIKQHRSEQILDTMGKMHFPAKEFWNEVLGDVLKEAFFLVVYWDDAHWHIKNLRTILQEHAKEIKYENDLPPKVLKAFLALDCSLERFASGRIAALEEMVTASPPLRKFSFRLPDQDYILTSLPTKNLDHGYSRLAWTLQRIWNKDGREMIGLHAVLNEIERLALNDRQANELLTPRVKSCFSDLAVLAECRHQLSLFKPWAATFGYYTREHWDELRSDFRNRMKVVPKFLESLDSTSLSGLGDPSDNRFQYPIDKRRTRETTAALQEAERALDRFWSKVNSRLADHMDCCPLALKTLLQSDRLLRRTPDWVEPSLAEPKTLLPLSEIYYNLELRTESTIRDVKQPQRKKKTKTRGTPSAPSTPVVADFPSKPQETNPQPEFKVDRRSLKAFKTLFFQPSRTAQPGEIPWLDFLHAMRAMGFEVEKLHGSVWQFTPASLDLERGIQFHEPHPGTKLPFHTARRYGRRLNRAYGWQGNMFSLADA